MRIHVLFRLQQNISTIKLSCFAQLEILLPTSAAGTIWIWGVSSQASKIKNRDADDLKKKTSRSKEADDDSDDSNNSESDDSDDSDVDNNYIY